MEHFERSCSLYNTLKMHGTVAITDYRWYVRLRDSNVSEVNFWKPSARQAFKAERFSPFFFKLPKPYYAICGFGFFAQYSALPVWLAWEAFGRANGCESLSELESRIGEIRSRIGYQSAEVDSQIGCLQIVDPVFFPESYWIPQPADWPVHGQRPKRYDLEVGEGRRIWDACLTVAKRLDPPRVLQAAVDSEFNARFGTPVFVRPRLGQGTFRIAVTEAYHRSCAISGEHSLPALDAAHIKPYAIGGEHNVSNGLLLRADLHRLFDLGYLTVTPDYKVRVSDRLRDEYKNGRAYYPFVDSTISIPHDPSSRPDRMLLEWHSTSKFAA